MNKCWKPRIKKSNRSAILQIDLSLIQHLQALKQWWVRRWRRRSHRSLSRLSCLGSQRVKELAAANVRLHGLFALCTKVACGGHAGCHKTHGKLEDACGLPLEAAFAFAVGADERRTAATRPAYILIKKLSFCAESFRFPLFFWSTRSCLPPSPYMWSIMLCFVRGMSRLNLVKNVLKCFILYSIEVDKTPNRKVDNLMFLYTFAEVLSLPTTIWEYLFFLT